VRIWPQFGPQGRGVLKVFIAPNFLAAPATHFRISVCTVRGGADAAKEAEDEARAESKQQPDYELDGPDPQLSRVIPADVTMPYSCGGLEPGIHYVFLVSGINAAGLLGLEQATEVSW
jgi:hypothetical protein